MQESQDWKGQAMGNEKIEEKCRKKQNENNKVKRYPSVR
jgi:hypothetical protein